MHMRSDPDINLCLAPSPRAFNRGEVERGESSAVTRSTCSARCQITCEAIHSLAPPRPIPLSIRQPALATNPIKKNIHWQQQQPQQLTEIANYGSGEANKNNGKWKPLAHRSCHALANGT